MTRSVYALYHMRSELDRTMLDAALCNESESLQSRPRTNNFCAVVLFSLLESLLERLQYKEFYTHTQKSCCLHVLEEIDDFVRFVVQNKFPLKTRNRVRIFAAIVTLTHSSSSSSIQRSRRGGGSSFRRPAPSARPVGRPKSTVAKPAAPPAPAQQSSVPAPQQASGGGGMLSGIGSTIAQGMAFGTGSAVAHRAVGAVAGSFGGGGGGSEQAAPEYAQGAMPAQEQQQFQGACALDKQMYYECLQTNKGDQQACQFLYDQLMQCQQNQTQFG